MSGTGRLAGKSALITGAGSGLGKASAVRFAQEGARVCCADINLAAADDVVGEIQAAGGTATAVQVDTTSLNSSEAMVAHALDRLGVVDILFANAGISGPGNAADTDEDVFDRVVAVNLKGVWLSARAMLPHMLERRQGVIINQASMAALIGLGGIFSYTAAKGGVAAMTKQMAIAYGPDNVRVNAICPGTIPTPLVYGSRIQNGTADESSDQAALDLEAAKRFPLQRLGVPGDVAALAVFLASDESNWLTGALIPVDGGRSAT